MTGPAPTGPVLAASGLVGSVTGLMAMAGGALVVVVAVLAGNLYMRYQRLQAAKPRFAENTVEASAGYRRYLVASAWAGGSARNWEASVRPVLAELVELTVARHFPPGDDPRARARELLGPELWPLVDREAPRTRDDSVPGAGRAAMVKILERLEAHDDEHTR